MKRDIYDELRHSRHERLKARDNTRRALTRLRRLLLAFRNRALRKAAVARARAADRRRLGAFREAARRRELKERREKLRRRDLFVRRAIAERRALDRFRRLQAAAARRRR